MSTRSRRRVMSALDITKDVILFGFGLALIYRQGWQVSKADFNWINLAVGVGLTQAPGAMAVLFLLRTGGGSSPEAPEAPSSPQPSPSPITVEP